MTERHANIPDSLRAVVNAMCPPAEPTHCPDCGAEVPTIFEHVDGCHVPEPAPAPFWTVAIYLIDRSYGGPEEGGWHYTSGDRIDYSLAPDVPNQLLLSVVPTEAAANELCKVVQDILDKTHNFGRRDIGSVLSTGRYSAEVYNGHPPKHFPETRPHYE